MERLHYTNVDGAQNANVSSNVAVFNCSGGSECSLGSTLGEGVPVAMAPTVPGFPAPLLEGAGIAGKPGDLTQQGPSVAGGDPFANVPTVGDSTLGGVSTGIPVVDLAIAGYEWLAGSLTNDGNAYAKPPKDAHDPHGAKAPGKPPAELGFKDPKGGESWVPNPNPKRGGNSHGWLDAKGHVWVPTGPYDPSKGISHGGSHWDVQNPRTGKSVNIYPLGKSDE